MGKPYELSQDSRGWWYPAGPGITFHGYFTAPNYYCIDRDAGERAVGIANKAYQEGYREAQRDIRKALGC